MNVNASQLPDIDTKHMARYLRVGDNEQYDLVYDKLTGKWSGEEMEFTNDWIVVRTFNHPQAQKLAAAHKLIKFMGEVNNDLA